MSFSTRYQWFHQHRATRKSPLKYCTATITTIVLLETPAMIELWDFSQTLIKGMLIDCWGAISGPILYISSKLDFIAHKMFGTYDSIQYQVRIWACSSTTSHWKGSWTFDSVLGKRVLTYREIWGNYKIIHQNVAEGSQKQCFSIIPMI